MAGARGELKNSVGDTPLHTAARYGHAGVARILLSAKCNPNLVNTNNDTPLHIAAAMGKRKLTKILMQNGAEPMIKNKQGDTAMDIALRRDLIEIQELIANPPPKSESKSQHRQHRRHHHQHQQPRGERDAANNHDNYHRHHHHHHSQQHLLRSASNLIVLDDKTRPQQATEQRHKRQLSISSNQQQANHQLLCSQLYSSSSSRLFSPAAGVQRTQLARASQPALQRPISRRNCDEASSSGISNRTPVDAVDRSRTLAGGLGVSSAALDELVRARRATPTQCDKPRPSSAGSVRRRPPPTGGGPTKRRILRRQRQQTQAVEPARDQHKSGASQSPTASVRSSQMSRVRGRRLVIGPRRLTLATGSGGGDQSTGTNLSGPSKRRSISTSHIAANRTSLLQLRQMIQRRQATLKLKDQQKQQQEQSANIHSSQTKLNTPTLDERQEDACAGQTGGSHTQLPGASATLGDKNETDRPQSVAASGGRRAMRDQEDTAARCPMRAPNGTKLLKTRPLAPLNDDTQLYAIPRKSAKAKQQVANDNDDNERRADAATDAQREEDARERPSGNSDAAEADAAAARTADNRLRHKPTSATPNGAALTASDSGHSLASGSSSAADGYLAANPAASFHSPAGRADRDALSCLSAGSSGGQTRSDDDDQMASSSDECIKSLNCPQAARQHETLNTTTNRPKSVGVREDEDDDRDFGAPGYSVVVRGRPREKPSAEPLPCHCPPQTQEALATTTRLHHHNHLLAPIERGESPTESARVDNQDSEKLIEPKSVLSGANAELIAAQKSLAAAAAAKVHRDRLAKMSRGPETLLRIGGGERNEQQLTVETDWLQHHQHHQTLVAAAASRVRHDEQQQVAQRNISKQTVGKSADKSSAASTTTESTRGGCGGHNQVHATAAIASGAGGAHRSGTNSVGMSDSSPSNNGAATDSDNSIQTTSGVGGSLNTDNASQLTDCGGGQQPVQSVAHKAAKSGKQQQQQQVAKSSSGPFGILSRILLNGSGGGGGGNSKAKSVQQANGVSASAQLGTGDTRAPEATAAHVKTTFSGSLSSSSALSSPSISTNGRSPNSTADSTATNSGDQQQQQQQPESTTRTHLDQLGSRSRRPIVLSQSNELSSSSESGGGDRAVSGDHPDVSQVMAPRPPMKGVLKVPSTGASGHKFEMEQRENLHEIYGSSVAQFMDDPNALVNGLPRVSSYTQIAAHHAPADPNNLCNYHALNRSHMIQAKYSPYLPYALGRYSIHETCDPSSGARTMMPYEASRMSQNGASSSSNARCYLAHHYQHANAPAYASTTTAYNHINHSNSNNSNNNGQDHSLAGASMLCHYSHDDSIYIPPFSHSNGAGDYHNSQVHSGGTAGGPSYGAGYQPSSGSRHEASLIDYHHSRPTMPTRPKSSLDTLAIEQQQQQQLYGQRPSATRHGSDTASIMRYAGLGAARSQSQLAEPVAASHLNLLNQQHHQQPTSSHHLITTTNRNSIYASHHLAGYSTSGAKHQHQRSELTVLPATSVTSSGSIGAAARATTTTIPISTKDTLAGPGSYKSLVQVNKPAETVLGGYPRNGHHNGTSGANNETSASATTRCAEQASPSPPTLPPKTMTTIGKLTKVSIKPRDPTQWQPPVGHHERATQFDIDVDCDDADPNEYMGATVL